MQRMEQCTLAVMQDVLFSACFTKYFKRVVSITEQVDVF